MDGGKDQIVLIEERSAGFAAGGIRRIERQFGQEAFAARRARRDLRKLGEISHPERRIFMSPLHMRRIPSANEVELSGPAGSIQMQHTNSGNEIRPMLRCSRRRPEGL